MTDDLHNLIPKLDSWVLRDIVKRSTNEKDVEAAKRELEKRSDLEKRCSTEGQAY